MAQFSSKPVVVDRPVDSLVEKFSDFTVLSRTLDELPAEEREKIGDVAFTTDSIEINTPQVGRIVLRATERSADGVRLQAEGAPVAMGLIIGFKPVGDARTEVSGTIDVEIPAMLRPLIGPTLQKAADQFGGLFARLA